MVLTQSSSLFTKIYFGLTKPIIKALSLHKFKCQFFGMMNANFGGIDPRQKQLNCGLMTAFKILLRKNLMSKYRHLQKFFNKKLFMSKQNAVCL